MAEMPWLVNNFIGGQTDNYLGGARERFQQADNFVIKKHGDLGKLITRPGSIIVDEDNPIVTTTEKRINQLAEIDDVLFCQMACDLQYLGAEGYATLAGPTGNSVFTDGDETNYMTYCKWNDHLIVTNDAYSRPMRIYRADDTWTVNNLGLPGLASSPTVTAGSAGSCNYLYAFIYSHTYAIDSVSFKEFGAITLVSLADSVAPESDAISISNIPELSNSTTDNYATSDIKIEIYRTHNNGTEFYKVGEVDNGTTTFDDDSSDDEITDNEVLYSTGNVLDYDQPPLCKYVHQVNNIIIFANIKDGLTEYPYRARYSNPGQPFAASESSYVDFDDEITGVSSVAEYPIVFCENRIYRVEGYYDDLGGGVIKKREISTKIGCISSRSIVQCKLNGRAAIAFASHDGFYITDGFTINKISDEINNTYKTFTNNEDRRSRIIGVFAEMENQVLWSVKQDSLSSENDYIYCYHLDFENLPNTTWSGGNNLSNFNASAMIYKDKTLLRADYRGYVFEHDDSTYTDPLVDTSIDASDWYTATIIFSYGSCAFDFGTSDFRKWVPKILINFFNTTPLSLLVMSNNDDSGAFTNLKEIIKITNIPWGYEYIPWGDEDAIEWNFSTANSVWRWFIAKYLRCQYKQVWLTNFYSEITNSTAFGQADVDSDGKTVTIDPTFVWPDDLVGYKIKFGDDETEYDISEQSNNIITLSDSEVPDLTDSEWAIWGYKKGEVLHLDSYTIMYHPVSATQEQYTHTNGVT